MAYLPLSTANLPNPAIDPAQGSSPADYFNTVLYDGQSTSISVTGVGFQPDFVWVKRRDTSADHRLGDAVRGTGNFLESSTTDAEGSTDIFTSFDSDGFSHGEGAAFNISGGSFVSWNWKANGAGSANSEGSITTTSTSANTTSGFSIIKWTGDGTIGHGLDQAPEMFIVKDLTAASSWWVWHKDLSNTSAGYMQLDDSLNAERTNTSVWRNAYPATATRIDVNTSYLNYSTDNYLALCFHSVEGFSKVGSYTGNGNADGTFVYTGFKVAFLLLRVTSVADDWIIWDGVRSPENLADNALKPNSNAVEVTGNINNSIDLVSNGFKCRNNNEKTNFNGYNYIYMAFAENPFKYSNAR